LSGVTVGWLQTGEGHKGGASTSAENQTNYTPYHQKVMNDVITAVEAHLEKIGGTLPPEKKAELVTLVYEETLEKEGMVVDEKSVARLIRLAK